MECIKNKVYNILQDIARNNDIIFYETLAERVDLNIRDNKVRYMLSNLLDSINEEEFKKERPMLSSVVIRQQENTPGAGFYKCAQSLNRLPENISEDDKIAFWADEIQAVYNEYGPVNV